MNCRHWITFFMARFFGVLLFCIPLQTRAVDSDSDGLPDWWEMQYFSNVTSGIATDFSDGDSFNNLEEYIAGTDPTNATSAFEVSMESVPAGTVLQWEGGDGTGL